MSGRVVELGRKLAWKSTATKAVEAGKQLPSFNNKRALHIFRDAPGHVKPVTLEEAKRWVRLFQEVASNSSNLRLDAVQQGIITYDAVSSGAKAYTWVNKYGLSFGMEKFKMLVLIRLGSSDE